MYIFSSSHSSIGKMTHFECHPIRRNLSHEGESFFISVPMSSWKVECQTIVAERFSLIYKTAIILNVVCRFENTVNG